MPIPDIYLNKKEIQQLLLNLVRNGIEAIPKRGKVEIKTLIDGGEVVLAIEDDGTGIDQEILDKLGTPFFTTKADGTGMGLATCYRIAEKNNARIDVETSSGGTTFFVRFKPH
jgi:signal transduction histidine kinase